MYIGAHLQGSAGDAAEYVDCELAPGWWWGGRVISDLEVFPLKACLARACLCAGV